MTSEVRCGCRSPQDASSIVVREYVGDAVTEQPATLSIEPSIPLRRRHCPTKKLAEQFTAMAWTLMKLATLHRTIKPELLTTPNVLLTAEAAELGAADTTPDNLYMIGTFRLGPQQSLLLEFTPPDTRYWNVTLENIWHECADPQRRHSSVTNSALSPGPEGTVRIAISAKDFGDGHWLDTGGRHRGFVILRWLDNPDPPAVSATVVDHGMPDERRTLRPEAPDRPGLRTGRQRRFRRLRLRRQLARQPRAGRRRAGPPGAVVAAGGGDRSGENLRAVDQSPADRGAPRGALGGGGR